MLESEIIKQLKSLKDISPAPEYSKLSKFIILSIKSPGLKIAPEKALAEKVSGLRDILPSSEFAGMTRELILAHPKTFAQKLGRVFSPANLANQGVRYGFSVAMAGLLLVITIGTFSGFRVVPGIDVKNLTAEADNIKKDIDINLEGADYFATTANKTRVALNDAKSNGTAEHSSQEVINKESRSFDFKDPTDEDINKMLNEATL